MNIDLGPLSVSELDDLGKRITKEIRIRGVREEKEAERLAKEKKKELLGKLRNLAAEHGMTVEEAISGTAIRRTRSSAGSASTGPKSVPKYRNPKDPNKTWTGKGRKPGWIVEGLEKGKTLEDFAI